MKAKKQILFLLMSLIVMSQLLLAASGKNVNDANGYLIPSNLNYYVDTQTDVESRFDSKYDNKHDYSFQSTLTAHLKDVYNDIGQVDEAGAGAMSVDFFSSHAAVDCQWTSSQSFPCDFYDPDYVTYFDTADVTIYVSIVEISSNTIFDWSTMISDGDIDVKYKAWNHIGGGDSRTTVIGSDIIEWGMNQVVNYLDSKTKGLVSVGIGIMENLWAPRGSEISITEVSAANSPTNYKALKVVINPNVGTRISHQSVHLDIPNPTSSLGAYNIITASETRIEHFDYDILEGISDMSTIKHTNKQEFSTISAITQPNVPWSYNRIVQLVTSNSYSHTFTMIDNAFNTGTLKESYSGSNWYVVPGEGVNDASQVKFEALSPRTGYDFKGWYVDGILVTTSLTLYLDMNDLFYEVKPVYASSSSGGGGNCRTGPCFTPF